MKRLKRTVVFGLAALLCAQASHARDVKYSGTGEIQDDGGLSALDTGDPITFSFRYDTDSRLQANASTRAIYVDERPQAGFTFDIDTPTADFHFACSGVLLLVTNDDPEFRDSFSVLAGGFPTVCTQGELSESYTLMFLLLDPTGSALQSPAIPDDLLDIADLDSRLLQLRLCSGRPCTDSSPDLYDVYASADTLEAQPVPEPPRPLLASAALTTLAALAALQRQRPAAR